LAAVARRAESHPGRIVGPSLAFAAALPVASGTALADHGPGTAGAGVGMVPGRTLGAGGLSAALRSELGLFEDLSSSDIQAMVRRLHADHHAHVDALRWTLLHTLEIAYGVVDAFQIGLAIGWYRGDDLREGHLHADGSYELHDLGDVVGATDLRLTSKIRFLHGSAGHAAVYGGIKLPTGRDDLRGDGSAERLDPSVQPGSGAVDFLLGLSYSRWLGSAITFDASAQYTLRTANAGFKIGDRLDTGVAAAWRATRSGTSHPQLFLLGELSGRLLLANREDREAIENSGGFVLFGSPGLRLAATESLWLSAAVQIPALQALKGEQQRTTLRIVAGLGLLFGGHHHDHRHLRRAGAGRRSASRTDRRGEGAAI
jgi:hypothetical protein